MLYAPCCVQYWLASQDQRLYTGHSAPALPNLTSACPPDWTLHLNVTSVTSMTEDQDTLPGNLPIYEAGNTCRQDVSLLSIYKQLALQRLTECQMSKQMNLFYPFIAED